MKKFRAVALAIALMLPFTFSPAFADALDSAKVTGQVGEQLNGMLGAIGTPSPATQALIAEINAKRLAAFTDIAKKQGQPLATVQAVAGADFIKRTPAGQYIQDASGQWVKK